jgi:hypothetical protein
MSVTQTSGSVIAQPGQQFSLSSLIPFGSGLPSTIGIAILDDDNYTQSNPGGLGYFSGNGKTSQVSTTTDQLKNFTYELFQYDSSTGQYVNPTLGSLNNLVYVAPTGNDHAELLSVFSFNSGASFDYSNLTDLGDLSVVTQTSFVNPFPGAMAGQATPNEISAIADSFVGKVWNIYGCQVLGNVIAGLAGSSLPFTALALISSDQNPVLAQPNGEWIVAYDGRTQANPTIAAVEAMIRPGDIVNIAWQNTSESAGHMFTVVSGSGASALVIDNEATGTNSAYDGSTSDIIIQPPHSLDETLNQYYRAGGGAVPASIEVYRLDTPIVTAEATPVTLADESRLTLSSLFTASDPAGKSVVSYQVYESASGNHFLVGGTPETAQSAATAITVSSLGAISLVGGTSGGSDTLEVRGFNGSYWGDWQTLSVTDLPAVTAAQAISSATAGQAVADSAQNVLASLDGLAGLAAKGDLASITLTDSGIPALTVTASQLAADHGALSIIQSALVLDVTASGASQTIQGPSNLATVVVFSGTASQYTLSAPGGGVVDVAGSSGTTAIGDAVALQFSDRTLTVTANHSLAEDVALLYQGALGRSPDPAGLLSWITLANALPASEQAMGAYVLSDVSGNYNGTLSIAGGFTNSAEFQTKYGSLSDAQFVTQLYANVLDRAPDAGGYATWMGELSAGQTREHVLIGFADSAEAISNAANGFVGQSGAHAAWLVLT